VTPKWDRALSAPPRNGISSFLKGLLPTGVPFVALFIIIAIMVGKGGELVWMLTLGLCVVALLVSAGFALADKRRVALGILAGSAVGVICLVLSCAFVLSTSA
jgi:hypothetical protein